MSDPGAQDLAEGGSHQAVNEDLACQAHPQFATGGPSRPFFDSGAQASRAVRFLAAEAVLTNVTAWLFVLIPDSSTAGWVLFGGWLGVAGLGALNAMYLYDYNTPWWRVWDRRENRFPCRVALSEAASRLGHDVDQSMKRWWLALALTTASTVLAATKVVIIYASGGWTLA